MITAKIISDSISDAGKRITSLQLHYPKFIHGEFMTHRVFSRNASSSRAIPFGKIVDDIINDTATPIHWGKNQPGMQAHGEIDKDAKQKAEDIWIQARNDAIGRATHLSAIGVHKQVINRLLEPFYNINVLVTATEWDNFFELRLHPDAQPEMYELARVIKEAMDGSKPRLLNNGEWHLPYVPEWEQHDYSLENNIKISVARCARVSYLTQEGKSPNVEQDLKLYDRLVGSVPIHASPAEHQATPDWDWGIRWGAAHLHGNFVGWKQYRKLLEITLKNP